MSFGHIGKTKLSIICFWGVGLAKTRCLSGLILGMENWKNTWKMVLPGKVMESHGIVLEQKSHGKVMEFYIKKVLMSPHYFPPLKGTKKMLLS